MEVDGVPYGPDVDNDDVTTKMKGTPSDQRNMWRMGKEQKMKVCRA